MCTKIRRECRLDSGGFPLGSSWSVGVGCCRWRGASARRVGPEPRCESIATGLLVGGDIVLIVPSFAIFGILLAPVIVITIVGERTKEREMPSCFEFCLVAEFCSLLGNI